MRLLSLILLLILSGPLFAQDFEKSWEEVVLLENDGKIRSALKLVDKIYLKAVRRKDEAQIIKCFFYESKYLQEIDENAQFKIFDNLKNRIGSASPPSKVILTLIYAHSLQDYLRTSRIPYNRGPTKRPSEKITEWTHQNFISEIAKAYDSIDLQAKHLDVPLAHYEPIFDFESGDDFSKMTLRDYALGEILEYHTAKLNRWNAQYYTYASFEKFIFGSTAMFASIPLDSIHDANIKKVIRLYQYAERLHKTPQQFFNRIKFANDYVYTNNSLYLKILDSLQPKHGGLRERIMLEKAQVLMKFTKGKFPDARIKALAIADSILDSGSRSNASKQARLLKHEVLKKEMDVQMKQFLYPGENHRLRINSQNVDSIRISFYRLSADQLKVFDFYQKSKDSLVQVIIEKQPAIVQDSRIENKRDHFSYSSEVILPALETGNYLAYFETRGGWEKPAFSYHPVSVTSLAVLERNQANNQLCRVVDRKTGKPIENVTISNGHDVAITDDTGRASLKNPGKEKTRNVILTMQKGDDITRVESGYYFNPEPNDTLFQANVTFLLDRAIYRPGQTVYFKGIAVRENNDATIVVSNTKFTVALFNANSTEIAAVDLVTNEFGSFSGSFDLPSSFMTGKFSIRATEPDDYTTDSGYNRTTKTHPFWDYADLDHSNIRFSVEEYKRPKFEVLFDDIKTDLLIGDEITISGTARSFAGGNVSGASVEYSVEPFVRWSNDDDDDYEEPEEISGSTITDDQGRFSIKFKSETGGLTRKGLPTISYAIEADVTDINGETQSASTSVNAGYHTLELTAFSTYSLHADQKAVIGLQSTNLNGEFVAAKAKLELFFISKSAGKFKARYWPKPEIETIPDSVFSALFPNEENVSTSLNPDDRRLVWSKEVDTKILKEAVIDLNHFEPGFYELVFSAIDNKQNSITHNKPLQILHPANKADPNQLFTAEQVNDEPVDDGYIDLKIKSATDEINVVLTVFHKNDVIQERNVRVRSLEKVRIPINSSIRKNVFISLHCVYDNSIHAKTFTARMPSNAPKALIETQSFRSKIEPGAFEKWSFRLKPENGFGDAEVLASMYDSSLDQFQSDYWKTPALIDNQYFDRNVYTVRGFRQTDKSRFRLLNGEAPVIELTPEGTRLMWFGFDYGSLENKFKIKAYRAQLTKKARKPLGAKMISGKVFDESGALPGANVIVSGTVRGVQTDVDGYFEIEAAPGEILEFSYLGMEDHEVLVGDDRSIEVPMISNSVGLAEVVVAGYSSTTRHTTVVAQSTVTSQTIENRPNASIVQTLQGQVAGLSIEMSDGEPGSETRVIIRGSSSIDGNKDIMVVIDGVPSNADAMRLLLASDVVSTTVLKPAEATKIYGNRGANGVLIITTTKAAAALETVKARSNLKETAFFLPHLRTDAKGNIQFEFSSPEALTAWKLRLLAHDRNANSAYLEKKVITQKDLMVMPNLPRFLREKDRITISAKVTNMTTDGKSGFASMNFFDPVTMKPIDSQVLSGQAIRSFSISPLGNTIVSWTVELPEGLQGLQYKIVAQSGNHSDGEEGLLPVLSNKILVTETIPLWVREESKKKFVFENFKNNPSPTLKSHQLVLEYTSNPAWMALKALPYLIEFEHECAEQTFARFYANRIANEIIASNPRIEKLLKHWRENGTKSKLAGNDELKSIILAETPWLRDAANEADKNAAFALLLDIESLSKSHTSTLEKLAKKQLETGGFGWFDGGQENEFITRHIIAGFGHLKKLAPSQEDKGIGKILKRAINFCDERYLERRKSTAEVKNKNFVWHQSYDGLHYLYSRSFHLDNHPLPEEISADVKRICQGIKNGWLTYSLYEQGMAALVLHRFGHNADARKIISSLKERSATNEDFGMYWIANESTWHWYRAPIEMQALLIEAFLEVAEDQKSADAMKVWLLRKKQNNQWPSTKSTSAAVYALLMQGTDWLDLKWNTKIEVGSESVTDSKSGSNYEEMETGYFRKSWNAVSITPEMAVTEIENKSDVPGYGGLFWQYFEVIDKIKGHENAGLSVSKKFYVRNSDENDASLKEIDSRSSLAIGEKVTVQLTVTVAEPMEFVHLKDLRAACFEPVDVLSGYHWKNGAGFYKSTKDAATHWFFDRIEKGTYIFEYDVFANNAGEFAGGIATLQSMYAPDFSSHSESIRINVK